jgi:hypothetical protein
MVSEKSLISQWDPVKAWCSLEFCEFKACFVWISMEARIRRKPQVFREIAVKLN